MAVLPVSVQRKRLQDTTSDQACMFALINGRMMSNFMPVLNNNINRKIFHFVKSKNIFSSLVSENWPLVTQSRCQNDSQCPDSAWDEIPERVPVFIWSGKTVLIDSVSKLCL